MRKIITLAFIICSVLILTSCEDKDEVADEIVDYYNEKWSVTNNMLYEHRTQSKKLDEFDQKGETNKAANLVRNESIPPVDEALDRFKSIDPANKRIKKLNDLQIEMDEHFKKGLKDIVTYYEGGDVSEQDIKDLKKKLNEKQDELLDYRDKLMDKYDLEEVEDADEDKRFPEIKRAEN